MKLKTDQIDDITLDWAVAACQGFMNLRIKSYDSRDILVMTDPNGDTMALADISFSREWEHGGPILDILFKKNVIEIHNGEAMECSVMFELRSLNNASNSNATTAFGKTLLVAAMRCYVKSKLGDEVEVPDALRQINKPKK